MDIQILIVQFGLYPLVVLVLAMDYDMETKQYNFFNFSSLMKEVFLQKFAAFQSLPSHFVTAGEMVNELELDDMEVGFMSAVLLIGSVSGIYKYIFP